MNAIGASHYLGFSLMTSAMTLGISLLAMSVLRCLHPPAGGLTLCLLLSEDLVRQQGFMLLLPILGIVTCLLICALIYNNLKGTKTNLQKYIDLAPTGKHAGEVKAMLADPSLKNVK